MNGAARVRVQMLYTNVDHVVDGQQRSGWQLMTVEPDLDSQVRDRLAALIQPELELVHPLPDFPTPEEHEAIDRRLAQIPTPDGVALIHTMPAGPDTTGRANTMSHLVVLEDEVAPELYGSELWCSPGWSTPFGPTAVRQAHVAAPGELVPGPWVTEESVAEFVSRPGVGAQLAQVAALLEPRLRARLSGSFSTPELTVVLTAESTAEAVLWIGALERTMAPATARRLAWSTHARVVSVLDADRVAESPFDLVVIPSSDRLDVVDDHPRLQRISEASSVDVTSSAWGGLVSAATQSDDWADVRQDMTGCILDRLPDHTEITPAWPLAMVEADNDGWLTDRVPGLQALVDREVMTCRPAALSTEQAQDLLDIVTTQIAESGGSDPGEWWRKLMEAAASQTEPAVMSTLAEQFVSAALGSTEWLTTPCREMAENQEAHDRAACAVREWWSSTAAEQSRTSFLSGIRSSLADLDGDRRRAALCLCAKCVWHGIALDEAQLRSLLLRVIEDIADGRGEAWVDISVPAELMGLIDEGVSDILLEQQQGQLRELTLPHLNAVVAEWLMPGLTEELPELGVLVLASLLMNGSRQDFVRWRRAMNAAYAQARVTWQWDSAFVGSVSDLLEPADVVRWAPALRNWYEVGGAVALSHRHTKAGQELAARCLRAGLPADPARPLSPTTIRAVQPWILRAYLCALQDVPLMTMSPLEAAVWSDSILTAWKVLATHHDPVAGDLSLLAYRAYAAAVTAVVAGVPSRVLSAVGTDSFALDAPLGETISINLGTVEATDGRDVLQSLAARVSDLLHSEQLSAFSVSEAGMGALLIEALTAVCAAELGCDLIAGPAQPLEHLCDVFDVEGGHMLAFYTQSDKASASHHAVTMLTRQDPAEFVRTLARQRGRVVDHARWRDEAEAVLAMKVPQAHVGAAMKWMTRSLDGGGRPSFPPLHFGRFAGQ